MMIANTIGGRRVGREGVLDVNMSGLLTPSLP